ncbi:MAG: hypothetical protein E7048_11315 [Lentisphaerae bacterium]|nr:hypothetical protein [Lentisphaerota bacterium]
MIYWSAGIAAIAGVLALLCCRRGNLAGAVGVAGTVIAAVTGLAGICISQPGLSALFMLPTLILAPAGAFHSLAYIKGHGNPGIYWGFFNLTAATMLALPLISDFVPFLIVWELMGIFSFVLVMFNYKAEELKRVAWIYLLACEAGGLLLMLFWALAHKAEGSGYLLVVIGMAGFGLKAGFPLLHLWLPEAHPAAPAPVSAIMSGAMINLGFWGILNFVFPEAVLLHSPLAFFGWTLLILGCIGSLGGIIFAFAQDNLKRLLAYSSIENMGIISMALGSVFLAAHSQHTEMLIFAGLGFVFHIINHALLKGTLFLGAGQVYCSTGTLSIDKMGGMMKKTPVTGSCFTLASLGISGLPPFNGFIGELMIYLAAFAGICSNSMMLRGAGILCALVLSLTGACAVVAFAKAVGGTFLGESRQISECGKESPWMYVPMIVLLTLAVLSVFAAPLIFGFLLKDIAVAKNAVEILWMTAIFSAVFYALCAWIFFWRRYVLVRGKENLSGPTWDCGYAKPSARMEYTGSAVVQALADLFNGFLRIRRKVEPPKGLFPEKASFEWEAPDGSERFFWAPLFKFFAGISDRVHKFQSGYLHMYVLIMTIALIAMIVWAILC